MASIQRAAWSKPRDPMVINRTVGGLEQMTWSLFATEKTLNKVFGD